MMGSCNDATLIGAILAHTADPLADRGREKSFQYSSGSILTYIPSTYIFLCAIGHFQEAIDAISGTVFVPCIGI